MKCVVTAGPTFEPLDKVRRLTNFSTGRLGCRLAGFLAERGHDVLLLLARAAACEAPAGGCRIERFDVAADLADKLRSFAGDYGEAVYHAAAVSDFAFGTVYERRAGGELVELREGKISTGRGPLLAELIPTPKLIVRLREWFPDACLVGWKYEVDGVREDVIAKALEQIERNRTDACVANGPAYGFGFGVVGAGAVEHFTETTELYRSLEGLPSRVRGPGG